MSSTLPILGLGLALCLGGFSQTPPGPAPGQPLTLTLDDALARARTYSQQVYSADIAARLAREDTVQAKAALLPGVDWLNQFIYTQPNGTPTGVFVANNGPRVYTNLAGVHGDLYTPVKRADYRRAMAAEAVARARSEIAERGLIAVVVQNYYAMVAGQRGVANAQQSLREARQFLDITQKQEAGGEAAHADVVRAQILAEQRQRDVDNAQVALDRAGIGFGVLLFADYGQAFTVVDDLDKAAALPAFPAIQALAANNNPFLRAAQATVEQQNYEIASARAARLPALSFDYFFGIDANQYAIHDPNNFRNLGSSAQATLTVPVWTWGAARSKVRQAELKLEQAQKDLSLTQRQLLASLSSFYREADAAALQLASLRRSLELSTESLRLTLLRYQAGEVTALEVSDAQSTLAQARIASDDGLVRYRMAVANLQTLTGVF
jgi:outer membrane protein TolC